MRVVINQDIELEKLDEDDIKTLKKNSVFIKVNANSCTVVAQKVDLFEDDMERVLDIIDHNSNMIIELFRYETGRYTLKQGIPIC
jgi:hypothetical protein